MEIREKESVENSARAQYVRKLFDAQILYVDRYTYLCIGNEN